MLHVGAGIKLCPFMTSSLDDDESLAFTSDHFASGETALQQYPLDVRLQSRCGCDGTENIQFASNTLRIASALLVSLQTELSRLITAAIPPTTTADTTATLVFSL
jgi:hypothetical protein